MGAVHKVMSICLWDKKKRKKPAVHVNILLSVMLTDTVALLYESQRTLPPPL